MWCCCPSMYDTPKKKVNKYGEIPKRFWQTYSPFSTSDHISGPTSAVCLFCRNTESWKFSHDILVFLWTQPEAMYPNRLLAWWCELLTNQIQFFFFIGAFAAEIFWSLCNSSSEAVFVLFCFLLLFQGRPDQMFSQSAVPPLWNQEITLCVLHFGLKCRVTWPPVQWAPKRANPNNGVRT